MLLDALARIRRSQRHLLGLVTQVLNFSRIEAGRVNYHVAEFSVARVLDDVREMIEPQARAKGIAIGATAPSGGLVLRADMEKVQQILLNLLSNAVKFARPGASVTVSSHFAAQLDGPEMVAILVRDTGRGIPSQRLEHVFEPFVQLDVSLTRSEEGTGLGLAISRDLARGMGGDLTAESTPGKGARSRSRCRAARCDSARPAGAGATRRHRLHPTFQTSPRSAHRSVDG